MGLLDEFSNFAQGASNAAASNITAPVDGISWLLRKAGLGGVIGNAPVGGSDWAANQGLTKPANGIGGLLGESAGSVLPMLAAAKAPQIAATVNQGISNYANAAPMFAGPGNAQRGATVWHGSPHTFDAFDASKIGTGEGAQAYGHGLYLADSSDVAKSYYAIADNLPGTAIYRINGANLAENSPEATAVKALVSYGGDVEKARNNLVFGQRANASIGLASNRYEKAQGLIDDIAKTKYDVYHDYPERQLYKVDLPDQHIAKMLDWDKPLSQQPQAVKALRGIADRFPGMADALQPFELGSSTGETIKSFMSRVQNPAVAAQALKDAGIPGIRYLDGGSRGAGAGSSNYVVFPGNEGLLSILERNGQPLK